MPDSELKMFQLAFSCCLIALAFGASFPDATEGRDFLAWSGRILGGTTASAGQFRFMVSLRTNANNHFCGGALFHPRFVVSAAHCTIARTTGNTIVVVGAVSRTSGGTTHSISRIINHPSYNAAMLGNDISVLQTSSYIATTVQVAPANLGSEFIGGGVAVIATGWGQTSNPGSPASNLQWAALTTLTNADCRTRFSNANAARVFDNVICTFTRSGQGTCMGDSGGPISQGNTIIGTVSWGIACARGSPDVYARVSSHRNWIASVTGV